jgi:ATP-dependent Clp protease ATP-binding subunit ClpB
MTSNIGSDHILNLSADDADYDKMQKQVMQSLRNHFRPEFLNRIDDLIIFHTLKRDELRRIVVLQIKRIEQLLDEQKITLSLSESALDHIVSAGYDPVYGARPLKRAIQRELENPIATKILENAFMAGDKILIDCVDNQLVFGKQEDVLDAAITVEDDVPLVEVEVISSALLNQGMK